MIVRIWRATAERDRADAYHRHATGHVFPALKAIAGHRGAHLLRREADGRVEFLAVTLWDSLETIKRFTGADPEVAVVEPAGRAALAEFDDFARHYEVADDPACPSNLHT
jgi:heme-degrading monooxygenase HmoA